jgi:transcription initiation factor TFIIIB Brf1 subunit/transcription initiation factor TFIIB
MRLNTFYFIKKVKFIRELNHIGLSGESLMSKVENPVKKSSSKELLAVEIIEYFQAREGKPITVDQLVETFNVDGKKIRRILRELRVKDSNLFYYKDGIRLIYVYKPSQEFIEKINKAIELKNRKNHVKPIDVSSVEVKDIEVEVVK